MEFSIIELKESWAQRERFIVRELDALPKCGKELVEQIRAQSSLATPP
jgi:hypothetical protein